MQKGTYASLSEAADNYYQQRESTEAFARRAKAAQSRVRKKISHAENLKSNLKQDLVQHGEPEQHKRIGDLLLANIHSARRDGNKVTISDFYSEGAPTIELELDENTSLKDEAARYFARYTKAKRAKEEIATRLVQLDVELRQLGEKQDQLAAIIESHDDDALTVFLETKKSISKGAREKPQVEEVAREVTWNPSLPLFGWIRDSRRARRAYKR